MNKKLFFVCIASLMLAACSEKVEQADTAKSDAASTNTEQVETEQDDNVPSSEQVESKETTTSVDNVEATETAKEVETNVEVSNEVEKVTEEAKEAVQTSLQPVDKDIDYYEYYETSAVVKTEKESNSESATVKDEQVAIVYEQLSEDVMQLPLLQDNEAYFDKDNIETISLAELEAIGAVKYYEEPLTRGYLIDINLSILKEHYLGHSYSFEYSGTEYGLMIDEAEKEYGFIFLKDVEGLLGDIKTNGTFNILN